MRSLSKSDFYKLIFFVLTFGLVLIPNLGVNAFELKISDQNMVRIDVKPIQLESGKKAIFQIFLNTHSFDLIYDMKDLSIIQDDEGRQYNALEWIGSPPGGHHRKGILEFPVLKGNPRSIKLIIKDIAGVSERVFKWDLK